ncbi:hypothetical protein PSN45_003282 [Yamadazyma tenuis]|uniref:MBA1-like protein n=1 Tax=Candida tenuis (strain ATCC 10573 / BCRC 21748 / CBS 615 / JCM 9827 / NBRC 10315 / NRRL Y-1498 / VKM Y-70) TaxID=590646 RepID=G3AYR9_CANTC|nr:MBA1-like protein [Yamadazyma tenuis ATCC 10573]EGV65914.1 MBA1-like protein [Yamadazyma tenuis ATCC 10573]WEJ95755.1 hypothetical protein PSN45_003282 [Yamadazyma tenuis]
MIKIGGSCVVHKHRGIQPLLLGFRTYASGSEVKPKKKTKTQTDISQIPVKSIATIADFYVPPKLTQYSVLCWHRLLFRRLGAFAINTYNIVKFKQDTKLKLRFNNWKEDAMEKFVRTNKAFAQGCSLPKERRQKFLNLKLEGNTGTLVTQSLVERAKSFPDIGKLKWELLSIEENPKVSSFTILPDGNDVTTYVQMVIKVKTKQKVTFTNGKDTKETEKEVSDNLVYTLNPFSDELVLVGKIFDSDNIRGIQPDLNFQETRAMQEFQRQTSDIFRANPKTVNS